MLSKPVKNQTEVLGVVFFILGEYEDIIEVHEDGLICVGVEYEVHHPRESGWSICKAERHDCVFIGAIACSECGLVNILFTDMNLMVSHPEIEL